MNCLPAFEHLCRKWHGLFIGFERFVKKKSVFWVGNIPEILVRISLGDYVNTREKVGTNHSKQRLLGERASPMLNR